MDLVKLVSRRSYVDQVIQRGKSPASDMNLLYPSIRDIYLLAYTDHNVASLG
jgi:hypothetical protein